MLILHRISRACQKNDFLIIFHLMTHCFASFLVYILSKIRSLRYRVVLKGFEQMKGLDKKKGIFFLSTHPSLLDWIILSPIFYPKFGARPVSVDYVGNLFIVGFMFNLVRAIWIPQLELGVSEEKIENVHKSIEEVVDSLKRGKSVFLSPSGVLRWCGKEILGGTSMTHRVLQQCPDVQIVLVRVRGLWGSLFSRVISGFEPSIDFLKVLRRGAVILLKNGIFFCRRRPVNVEILAQPEDFPRKGTRQEINRYLEKWFNDYPDGRDEEPITLVSYKFWRDEFFPCLQPPPERVEDFFISNEVKERVYPVIRSFLKNPAVEIDPDADLSFDLGFDSLDRASLVTEIVKTSPIENLHLEKLVKVRDLLKLVQSQSSD